MNKQIFHIALLMLTACIYQTGVAQQQKKEILLIGTFHFHNPGADVAKTKTFDVLAPYVQQELEEIAKKIQVYKPSKIFVEWESNDQEGLDKLYKRYQGGHYFEDSLSDFYRKNEIIQLGFRTAQKLGMERVYGIDFLETEFPFDSVMQVMTANKQEKLQEELYAFIQDFTTGFNNKVTDTSSIKELLYYLNTPEIRATDISIYTDLMIQAGDSNNSAGAFLASEWYRRNIYMWSALQKALSSDDERIMVLLGASHVAILNQLLSNNPKWKTVELLDIMK